MRWLITTLFITTLMSCIISKESRILKKNTQDWRKATVVLEAYGDSPFGGTSLTLRQNHTFECTSSGFFMFDYAAGNWLQLHDTIALAYVNTQHAVIKKENVLINQQRRTIDFLGDTSTTMSLRISVNLLGN